MKSSGAAGVNERAHDAKSTDAARVNELHHFLPAGLDYVATNTVLDFAPGVTMQTVKVGIIDDIGKPRMEGEETFLVILRMPVNAILGEPKEAVVTINDSISDCEYFSSSQNVFEVLCVRACALGMTFIAYRYLNKGISFFSMTSHKDRRGSLTLYTGNEQKCI